MICGRTCLLNAPICRLDIQVPNHLSRSQKLGNSRNPGYLLKYKCGTVQVFSTCSAILRTLNRLIKVRQTLLCKHINLYLLKTVSLFTFHSLLYILHTIFSLYPEIQKIQKFSPPLVPSFSVKWLSTCGRIKLQ